MSIIDKASSPCALTQIKQTRIRNAKPHPHKSDLESQLIAHNVKLGAE